MTGKEKCPQPVGYFTLRCDKEHINKLPAACNSWTCPVCGQRKKRRFLYSLKVAANCMINDGYRFRGLTLTLGQDAKNEDLGKYWHRFIMSLKKAGYSFEYLWVKEFQQNGKLHMHALITTFIPWNVIKYYWRLATKNTSFIVWIAKAQVQHTAAYISKYIAKDLTTAPFRRGERRYGMSKGLRKAWPKLKAEISDMEKIEYVFTYKPDNGSIIRKAVDEQNERKKQREKWQAEMSIRDNRPKHKH